MSGIRATAGGLCLVFLGLIVDPAIQAARQFAHDRALRKYERYLSEHRYSSRASDSDAGLYPENPRARYEQEYLMIMDPSTGRVPRQGLVKATERAHQLRRRLRFGKSANTELVSGWIERGPNNVGGRTRAIMFDPNDPTNKRVYAGGVAGGLWYTDDVTDTGEPWHSVDDFWANIAISTIAHDSSNTNVWYVGTGEGWFNFDALRGGGIFKSTDGGETWSLLPSTTTSTFQTVQKIVVSPTGAVLAATRGGAGGIVRSDNEGSTWTTVLGTATTPASNVNRAADLEIAANGDIYASLGLLSPGQVFKSSDDGLNWTHVFGDPTGTPGNLAQFAVQRIEIAVAPSDSNRVYLIAQNESTYGVDGMWRSSDGGASWQDLPKPVDCSSIGSDITRGQAWYDLILAVNPTNEDQVIVGGINVLRSNDGGTTWSNITRSSGSGCGGITSVHPDQHALVFQPGSSQALVIGNDGGIHFTSNMTVARPTYVNRNNGYNITQYYSAAQSPDSAANRIVGGTQDNGTPLLNNPGESGELADVTGGDGAYTHVNQQTNVSAFASNQWLNLHYSSNGGQSFTYLGRFSGGSPSFINPSDLDENTDHLYFNYSSSGVARLQQPPFSGSVTANLVGPEAGFGSAASHIRTSEYAPAMTSTIFVGTLAGRLFRGAGVESGGSPSWSELNALPPSSPGSISSIDLGSSDDTLLVTISNYGRKSVWLTHDGGSNWTDLDSGSNLPDMPVWWGMFHPDNPDQVFIGTEVGLWYTEDVNANPVSWSVDPEIPLTRVVTLRYRSSDRQLLAVTHGRGTWTATIPKSTDTNLEATVLLEGGHSTQDSMATTALFRNSVPLNQPFSDAAFNDTPMDYDGIESVGALPANTIDWVLVSLRTGTGSATAVSGSTIPAFVLADGSIVGLDGGILTFPGVDPGNYHVVVRHRNHLPVLSATAYDFATGLVTLDFTTGINQAYLAGGAPMKEVASGVWAMIAGDGNVDGQITANDFNLWLVATKAVSTGYLQADFAFDAQVTAIDFNLFLENTKAAYSSQVP